MQRERRDVNRAGEKEGRIGQSNRREGQYDWKKKSKEKIEICTSFVRLHG